MKIARMRLVNFEDRTLAAIGSEKVRTVLAPTVKHRLVTLLIVAHANDEMLFDPDQKVLEREAGIIKGRDEVRQQSPRRHGGITGRAFGGERKRLLERVAKQRGYRLRPELIIGDRLLYNFFVRSIFPATT